MQTCTWGTPARSAADQGGQLGRLAQHDVGSPAPDDLGHGGQPGLGVDPGEHLADRPGRRPPRTAASAAEPSPGRSAPAARRANGSCAKPARCTAGGVRRRRGDPYLVARRRAGSRERQQRTEVAVVAPWSRTARACGNASVRRMPPVSLPVVAEIVRSGFVEGHHHGCRRRAGLLWRGRLVGGRGGLADPAAVVQQAAPGAGDGAPRARPRAGAARPGVRLALGRGVPRRRVPGGSWRWAASTSPRCRRRPTTRSTTRRATR